MKIFWKQGAGAGAAQEAAFPLLRYFTTTSLAAFVIVAALLGLVFRQLTIGGLIDGYENEHVNLARLISNQLWASDFGPFVAAMDGRSVAELKAAPQIPVLQGKVRTMLAGTSIFKVKVYGPSGMTLFSTESRQIGEDKSGNAAVIAGLQGRTSSELSHKDSFSSFEGEVQNRDLVETYVPRFDPASHRVTGVFEIYGDATDILAEIAVKQQVIGAAVVGILALLYALLFVIVNRAQRLIERQNRERELAQEALRASEERWKFALEGAGAGVWDRNLLTGEVVFSKRYKEIYGFGADELDDRRESWDARVHPDDLAEAVRQREAYFAGESEAYASERRMQCKDGSWKWVLSRGIVVAMDERGRPSRMIGTHTDVTERHEREQALRLAATVFEIVDEAVVVTDLNNRIVSVNPAFTAITGYAPEEVVGKNPKLLASGSHSPVFYQAMWRALAESGSWRGEIWNRAKSGKVYVEWLAIKQVRDEQGEASHYVAVFSDISERKAAEERMQQLAHYDALTGLPNRTLFHDRLQQSLAKAKRDKTCLALMFIDLDEFKPINDSLGHHVGDLLLKEVARRLLDCLRRESDTVGRLGGDEFVVILPDMETLADATRVAEKILEALARPCELAGRSVGVSASIGIAAYPEHGADDKQLLKSADAAMYQAKQAGRNRYALYG